MTALCPDFSNGNVTRVALEIMVAIREAKHGAAHSRGDGPWRHRLTEQLLERQLAIYSVATGIAPTPWRWLGSRATCRDYVL